MTEQPEHNTRARPNTHHAFSVHALPGALDLHGVVQAGLCLDDNGEVGRHVLAHKVVVAELGRMPAGHARQPLASSRSGAAPLGAASPRLPRHTRPPRQRRAARCALRWAVARLRCSTLLPAGLRRCPYASPPSQARARRWCWPALQRSHAVRPGTQRRSVRGRLRSRPAACGTGPGFWRPTPGNVCWSSRELTQPTVQQGRPAGSLAQSRRRRPGRQRSGAAGGLGRPADHRLARHLVRLLARIQASERDSADLCGLRRGALGEQLRQQRQAVQHKGQVSINASSASHASTTAGARAPHSVITRVRCVHVWVVRRQEVPEQSH